MMATATNDSTPAEQQQMVESDPDFILLKRFEYSLERALKKYPEGLDEKLVAQALGKSSSWVSRRYKAIVEKLRAIVTPEER